MSDSANNKLRALLEKLTYEEKLIVLAALEQHQSGQEMTASPAR